MEVSDADINNPDAAGAGKREQRLAPGSRRKLWGAVYGVGYLSWVVYRRMEMEWKKSFQKNSQYVHGPRAQGVWKEPGVVMVGMVVWLQVKSHWRISEM